MAIVFDASSDDAVIDVLYERPQHVIDRQERRYREYRDNGDRKPMSRLQEATQELYTRVRHSRVCRSALAATRRIRNRNKVDAILDLEPDIGLFQHASRTMQDVIMANPVYKQRYRERRLEGYAGDWTERNAYQNSVKHDDPLYQVINNEVTVKEDDGLWAYNYVLSEEEKNTISIHDRAEARMTWETANGLLWDSMEDPTSIYNALL